MQNRWGKPANNRNTNIYDASGKVITLLIAGKLTDTLAGRLNLTVALWQFGTVLGWLEIFGPKGIRTCKWPYWSPVIFRTVEVVYHLFLVTLENSDVCTRASTSLGGLPGYVVYILYQGLLFFRNVVQFRGNMLACHFIHSRQKSTVFLTQIFMTRIRSQQNNVQINIENTNTNNNNNCYYLFTRGRDSSVGIATRYGLGGPMNESRWGRDFSHPSSPALGPTQPPVRWVPGLSWG